MVGIVPLRHNPKSLFPTFVVFNCKRAHINI